MDNYQKDISHLTSAILQLMAEGSSDEAFAKLHQTLHVNLKLMSLPDSVNKLLSRSNDCAQHALKTQYALEKRYYAQHAAAFLLAALGRLSALSEMEKYITERNRIIFSDVS